MPHSSAPGAPLAISTAVSVSTAIASRTGRLCRSPSVTSVPGAPTINPAHSRPIVAMRSPIPAAIACFIDRGIAVISRSRRPMPAVRTKIRPATATPPSATRQGTFIPTTTEYTKKKLWPMAGATAIG
jgi:hypothetical protein